MVNIILDKSKESKLLKFLVMFPGVTRMIIREIKDSNRRYPQIEVFGKILYASMSIDYQGSEILLVIQQR